MQTEAPTPARLTPRQLEVLELMAKGLTNREIARVLGIASGTAKLHVSAVIDALEVTNRTEAAVALQDFRAGEAGPRTCLASAPDPRSRSWPSTP